MPEIWLKYGSTEIVLDIKAENLERKIDPKGISLTEEETISRLNQFDFSRPTELVLMDYSDLVQKVITSIFEICNRKSFQKPKLLVEKPNMAMIKNFYSDSNIAISEFNKTEISNSNLVFLGEVQFDGLFGFDTVATKLTRKFGKEQMLEAYEKRKGDLPASGEEVSNFEIAKKFTNSFEISALEFAGNSNGVQSIEIGHPSKTSSITKSFFPSALEDFGKNRTIVISTGMESNDETFGKSLSSLWNCSNGVRDGGLAILLSECGKGIGSEAIQQYIEGRISLDRLRNPSRYIDGMEDLLFLTELLKNFQIGIISTLPEFYTKEKFGMIPFNGVKELMDYILKTQGLRQKVTVVSDASHVLLR